MKIYSFLLSIYICVSFGKSYQSAEHNYELLTDNQTTKPAIIARMNDTEAEALAEVMDKKPKFFDEFEGKCSTRFVQIMLSKNKHSRYFDGNANTKTNYTRKLLQCFIQCIYRLVSYREMCVPLMELAFR